MAVSQKKYEIHYVLKNVRNVSRQVNRIDDIGHFFGFIWKIHIDRVGNTYEFRLICVEEYKSERYYLDTKYIFGIVTEDGETIVSEGKHSFHKNCLSNLLASMEWKDVEKYLHGGDLKVSIEAKIDIIDEDNMKLKSFDESAKKMMDEMTIAENEERNLHEMKPPTNTFPEKKFKINYVLEDVRKISEIVQMIKDIGEFFGFIWRLHISRLGNNYEFRLVCLNPDKESNYGLDTKYKFGILKESGEQLISEGEHSFDENCSSNPLASMKLEDFNENLHNGKLAVSIAVERMENIRMKLEDSDKSVTIIIENKKFSVDKTILASKCEFFKNLFVKFPEDSQKSEIPLNGMGPFDFHIFVQFIYGESCVNEYTVQGLLELGETFKCPSLIRACEQFLLESSTK